jgi:hypothetical protein
VFNILWDKRKGTKLDYLYRKREHRKKGSWAAFITLLSVERPREIIQTLSRRPANIELKDETPREGKVMRNESVES